MPIDLQRDSVTEAHLAPTVSFLMNQLVKNGAGSWGERPDCPKNGGKLVILLWWTMTLLTRTTTKQTGFSPRQDSCRFRVHIVVWHSYGIITTYYQLAAEFAGCAERKPCELAIYFSGRGGSIPECIYIGMPWFVYRTYECLSSWSENVRKKLDFIVNLTKKW